MSEEKTVQSSSRNYMIAIVVVVSVLVMMGSIAIASFAAGMYMEQKRTESLGPTPSEVLTEDDLAPGFDVFWEAWQFVEEEFFGDIPSSDDRLHGAIRGMVNTYGDENTAYIDPVNARIIKENSSGSYAGIGAAVNLDEVGRLIIVEPFVGRPAAEAGILRNDIVLAVNGQSLRGMSLQEAVSLIRGPAGSEVALNILREGEDESFDIFVIRANIDIEVVESTLLEDNIAHIRLSDFSSGAYEKLYEAIVDMQAQGATKLILDLRSNPGGFLQESVAVTSLFIQDTIVLRERRKGNEEERVYNTLDLTLDDLPLETPVVVLVNRGSASASEIVAGALKENGRATVIGEQTFGKGTVQTSHALSNEGEVRITIAQWLTPEGNFIHKNGIVPDIVVERTQEDFLNDLDPQLDQAIEYLNEFE